MMYALVALLLTAPVHKPEVVIPITNADSQPIASAVLLNRFTALTVAHAVGPERTAVFFKCGDDDIAGQVVRRAPVHDLALITLYQPCDAIRPVALAEEEPGEGDMVVFDGYPAGKLSHGIGKVRSYGLFALPKRYFGPGILWIAMIIDGDVRPGNSGGPVLVNGRLVGLVHGYHESTEGKPGIVVPLVAIAQFLGAP